MDFKIKYLIYKKKYLDLKGSGAVNIYSDKLPFNSLKINTTPPTDIDNFCRYNTRKEPYYLIVVNPTGEFFIYYQFFETS